MSRHLLLAGLLALLAGVSGAQGPYVVDAAGGPGSHFKSLPAAVAAVPSGSYLFLRPGRYEPFRVAGKALHIRGSGAGATSIFLDETTGSVEIDSVPPGEVFTLEELRVLVANYPYMYPFFTPPGVRAPFLKLQLGSFALRGLQLRSESIQIMSGGSGSVRHGSGLIQVQRADLFATGVTVTLPVAHQFYDNPGEALPAALSATESRILLKECTLNGPASSAPLVSGGVRKDGAPGLLLDRSRADLVDLSAQGGSGSGNSVNLSNHSIVPPGNGGPGILLGGSSLALLDRGMIQGGSLGILCINPMGCTMQYGINGPGMHVEAGSGVRIRETVVQGATAYSRPAPAWTGTGRFQAFLPPLNRPLLSWNRGGLPPDRGRLVVSGAPGDLLVLLASSRPAWVPLGDLGLAGTLFLDFLSPDFRLVGPVRLSAKGQWELPLQAPGGTGVLGPWYLQAIRAPEGDQSVGSNLVQLTLWP